MLAAPLAFPSDRPPHITRTIEEPVFDPARHLALTRPQRTWTLEEFGYDAALRARTASPIAITSTFRVLSDEGTAALQHVLRTLRQDAHTATGRRLSVYLTGGAYRSRFLRDLVASQALVDHFSAIAKTELVSHSIPHFQAYVNYAPDDPSKAVDTWHVDSLGYDAVLMVSDPNRLKGGRFQFFRGTFNEAARLVGAHDEQDLTSGWAQELPADRVESVAFPAAGWAVFMQGDFVFHRAGKLEEPGERITVVPGYMSRDLAFPDRVKSKGMQNWRDKHLMTEVTRYAAWLGREKLARLIDELRFQDADDRKGLAVKLEAAVADVLRIAQEMREGPTPAKD